MGRVELVSDGRSEWRLQNVSPDSPVCAFAVGELLKYVAQISGCELRMFHQGASSPVIAVGLRRDMSPEATDLLPHPITGHDGYSLRVSPYGIIVAGDNERGVVYGVYDLLEQIGCRWFYPQLDPLDAEVVPRMTRITLPLVSKSVASPMRLRICNASSFFFDIRPDMMVKQLDAAMKARYNGMGWQCDHKTYVGEQYREMEKSGVIAEMKRRGMFLHGPAHSFPHFLRNEYFEEHPEWFGMRDGRRVKQEIGGAQFCWSNSEARRRFVDNAEQFVTESPGLDIFCSLGFDGGVCCDCPECRRYTPADLVITLMNEVVERLQASAPHVEIEMSGGYDPVHEPPENTKPHDALRVIWAHWGRYHGYGYDDPKYGLIDNLEKWRRAFPGRLTLCQYYTDNFATPWISAPYPVVLEGDRRYCLSKGVDAVYMLMWSPGYWWNHGFNGYMAGMCYYDFSLDPWDVIRDYAVRYFGENAGQFLAEYFCDWVTDVDLAYRIKDGTTDSDTLTLRSQRERWIAPAIEATHGDALLCHRVGKVVKLHDLAERLDGLHRLRREIGRLRETGRCEQADAVLQEARTYAANLLAHMESLADTGQGLIDHGDVSGFIRLIMRQWLDG